MPWHPDYQQWKNQKIWPKFDHKTKNFISEKRIKFISILKWFIHDTWQTSASGSFSRAYVTLHIQYLSVQMPNIILLIKCPICLGCNVSCYKGLLGEIFYRQTYLSIRTQITIWNYDPLLWEMLKAIRGTLQP